MAEKINSIIWDLGDVVYAFDQTLTDNGFAKISGLDAKEVAGILYGQTIENKGYNAGVNEGHNLGTMTSEEFYKAATKALNINLGYEEFTRVWSDIFTVNEKVRDFIIESHNAGIPQAVLSSTNPMHLDAMNKLFDIKNLLGEKNVFATFHAGYKKPTRELFDAFFSTTGFEKHRSVYVDDVQKYVDAAEKYGLGAIVRVDTSNPQFQEKCIMDVQKILGL